MGLDISVDPEVKKGVVNVIESKKEEIVDYINAEHTQALLDLEKDKEMSEDVFCITTNVLNKFL